ncbi:isoprenoid synthase domain-containing protein [Lentinula lateritia]|uniref:Isoprenoid synthase domain-containing protein n=1 Tax=Lentinula aff. lateritia TaxID=2804960 RepID=A0ACC1TTH8_9AGAR|nr:isoprenoid synthase domain-containing protein [Lentinula aff. lateritia]KAJ3854282.1 isoprenoid synthase domain-containing protein [Lentinula lateritia]
MAPFASHPVDTASVSPYFSSFPVRSCELDALPVIQQGLNDTIYGCTTPGSKERKRAEYRHTNPAGNIFGLSLALCEADRVGYVVKFIEFLCIVDDVMEDLPFGEACTEHTILRQALHDSYDEHQYDGRAVSLMRNFLYELRIELASIEDPSTSLLLKTLDSSLRDRDSKDSEFLTLAGYIPYRKMNFDYDFVCQLLRWAMCIPPTIQDDPLARSYEHIIGVIVGLTNDYFSWEMERQEPTDRIRNAVLVLMKEHSVNEMQAKLMLKEVIIEEERKARELMSEIMGLPEEHEPLKRYVAEMELFAAGYSFWCATCPRYHRPQKEENFVEQAKL